LHRPVQSSHFDCAQCRQRSLGLGQHLRRARRRRCCIVIPYAAEFDRFSSKRAGPARFSTPTRVHGCSKMIVAKGLVRSDTFPGVTRRTKAHPRSVLAKQSHAFLQSEHCRNRDRGRSRDRSPPTPPDVLHSYPAVPSSSERSRDGIEEFATWSIRRWSARGHQGSCADCVRTLATPRIVAALITSRPLRRGGLGRG
jgi:hypothetical protein